MELDGGGYIADFMGPNKRNKDANWFKGTHFSLGDENKRNMVSQSHNHYRVPTKAETAPNTYDTNAMTRTHFLLGSEKNLGVTTANASYQPPSSAYAPQTLDENTKADLRKSHFNLGGNAGRYITTNRRDFIPKQGLGTARDEQEERKIKMRKHNFNFGKEGNDFVSTNNASYQNFAGTGAAKITKASNDIGKTHFQLGGMNAPMRTVNQIEYTEKKGLNAGKTKDSIAFQCTNFAFGDDRPNKISSTHMQFKNYPNGNSGKLNREQLNELRKEHFIFGKHPNNFQSVSHIAHGDKGMNMLQPIGSKKGNQASHVQIGDPNYDKNFFQTTYEVANQSRPLGNVS